MKEEAGDLGEVTGGIITNIVKEAMVLGDAVCGSVDYCVIFFSRIQVERLFESSGPPWLELPTPPYSVGQVRPRGKGAQCCG